MPIAPQGRVTPQQIAHALDEDPQATAEAAGLRYVSDDEPGLSRRRCGKGFSYRYPDGRTVRDRRVRARIAALAVPPAWRDVWICHDAEGHIQALGRDDAGRKQYLYHERWRQLRDREKYDRMRAFARVLPKIRRRVRRDLAREGLARERVLAAVVRLLETSLARVGNRQYAEQGSYGLTTIRKKHVEAGDDELTVEFVGKGGKPWRVEVEDPRVEDVILECLDTPGYELFKYFDDQGDKRVVTSGDVNAYLRQISGANVHAKDFRTWAGTVLAAMALSELERAMPDVGDKRRILRAVEKVAEELGNTPSICRQSYIHPEILEGFDGDAVADAALRRARDKLQRELSQLRSEEALVLAYLERRLAERADAAE